MAHCTLLDIFTQQEKSMNYCWIYCEILLIIFFILRVKHPIDHNELDSNLIFNNGVK